MGFYGWAAARRVYRSISFIVALANRRGLKNVGLSAKKKSAAKSRDFPVGLMNSKSSTWLRTGSIVDVGV